jgi:hypothetical protein
MSALDMADVMDGLAELCVTADLARNVYSFPVESVSVPCVVVAYPTTIEFDLTFKRGGDRMVVPLFFVVGKANSRDTRDALSLVMTGTGSIKEALDGAQSFGDVRITDAAIQELTIGGVPYMAARFQAEVI